MKMKDYITRKELVEKRDLEEVYNIIEEAQKSLDKIITGVGRKKSEDRAVRSNLIGIYEDLDSVLDELQKIKI